MRSFYMVTAWLCLSSILLLAGNTASSTFSATVSAIDEVEVSGSVTISNGDFSMTAGKMRATDSSSTLSALTNEPSSGTARNLNAKLDSVPSGVVVKLWLSGGSETVGSGGSGSVSANSSANAVSLTTSDQTIITNMKEYSLANTSINYRVDVTATALETTHSLTVTWTVAAS